MDTLRVCVADDCVDVATIVCEELKLNDYDAFPVHTGNDALKACKEGHVDILLLDICLPDIDGYEVCRRLKENPATKDIIVIFVTVKGRQEDVDKGFELGAADYITKPFNLPIIILKVDAAVRRFLGTEKLDSNSFSSFGDEANTDHLTGLHNVKFLMKRLEEELSKAKRYKYPVSCIVFDVQEVQALDPDLGPVSMDDLLVELAVVLRESSRTSDIVARYDATLFAAVLPHCSLKGAQRYAEKIVNDVSLMTFCDPGFPTRATLQTGIATWDNYDAPVYAKNLLGKAMRNLLKELVKATG